MTPPPALVTDDRSPARRLFDWAARVGLERKVAVTLAVASLICMLVTYLVLTGMPPVGSSPRTKIVLLALNLVLLLAFGAVVASQLVEVWAQRRRGLAGSRLHVRLVLLISAVAVTPTIAVAIFSYLLLSFGMESWFSDKVRTALSESRAVAQSYLEEHEQNIRNDAIAMADDLSANRLSLMIDERRLSEAIESEINLRSMSEAIVFDADTTRLLARSALSFTLEFDPPPSWAIVKAKSGEAVVLTSQNEDRVRALVKIDGLPNALLYVGRPVEPRVLAHMATTNQAVDQYERLESERSGYQVSFILIFGAAALLLLLAAVWVGLNFATGISRRISGLVVAAERVRGGDLSARVVEADEADEFGSLSRAFNRMTGQLESQQRELVEANQQLDLRRRFTEAILSGVTAGVLGLDERGVIDLPNRSAAILLGIEAPRMIGQPLRTILPEMAALLDEAVSYPGRLVEGQIRRLVRGRGTVLLVRISAERSNGQTRGFVVTFDDITELLTAQRKAAWADVARRIAHEIKNPLTPIQLSAERLKRKYLKEIKTDPATFQICTDTIIRQVGDIGRMVDEFSSFARMPAPVMREEILSEIVLQSVFLQRAAHSEMQFDLDIPPDPVTVNCDSRQVSQALTNLLQNAVDAIQARQVAEAGRAEPSVPGRIQTSLTREPGWVRLTVEDNGKGLPADGRETLTEPYVTTRTKGTGLGLAIVKKIMEDHAGELTLEDGGSGGARVGMAFPVLKEPMIQMARTPADSTAKDPVVAHGA